MNTFYRVVQFFRDRLASNPDVNTVIFGTNNNKDIYKKSIYPLVHINPIDAPFDTIYNDSAQFTFEIAVLEQRDISKLQATDKFESNDDLIDNLNITWAILNDLVAYVNRQNTDINMDIVSINPAQVITYQDYNILDGWALQLTVQIPNEQNICR